MHLLTLNKKKTRWQTVSLNYVSVKKIQLARLIEWVVQSDRINISQKTEGTEGFCGMNTGGANVNQPEFVL
jgi:hypothetical protein